MTPTYHVEFLLDGQMKQEPFQAPNAGAAFAKCLERHPDALLVRAIQLGKLPMGAQVCITYDPPPVQRALRHDPRPPRAHKTPTENETTFGFYIEIKPRPVERRRRR